jgi:hypothetical protein
MASNSQAVIDSSGNVGIGTSSPATKFVVSNAGAGGIEIIPSGTIQSYNRSTSAYQTMNLDFSTLLFRPSGTEAMRISSSGGLSVGNTTDGGAGSIITTAGTSDGNGSTTLRVTNPGGAQFFSQTTPTGAIQITLPQTYTDTMVRMTVRVYTYDGLSFDIYCGGYNYSGGFWINTFAYMDSPAGRASLNVRFGNNGTKSIIYIGELATVWQYPQVAVVDFQAGYANTAPITWNSGWNITLQTSAFAGVTSTQTAFTPVTNNGGTWGINVTGSAGTATTATTATYLSGTAQINTIIGKNGTVVDINSANDSGSMSVRGDATYPASVSFHRTGVYAINMGLTTANNFVIGGWSATANAFSMTGAGALTMAAGITATTGDLRATAGNLTFGAANPTISASSYFTAPGGAYFSSGTVYTEASLRARGGVSSDTTTNLVLGGGTSGNTAITGAAIVSNGVYAESTAPFHLNATTVSANFTIPASYNAVTAGTITINTGVTVTVSTGSSWVVV